MRFRNVQVEHVRKVARTVAEVDHRNLSLPGQVRRDDFLLVRKCVKPERQSSPGEPPYVGNTVLCMPGAIVTVAGFDYKDIFPNAAFRKTRHVNGECDSHEKYREKGLHI